MNKRSRSNIHIGDRVRMEHTLNYGTVIAEEGITVTVKFDNDPEPKTSLRKWFVPVLDKPKKL